MPAATAHLDAIDAVESLRRTVLEQAPSLATFLSERQRVNWRQTPPRDRAAVAVACALDLPADTPAGRRHARGLLQDLERDAHLALKAPTLVVREEPGPAYKDLTEEKRAALGRDAAWAMSEQLSAALAAASGPVAAMKMVEKKAPLLKGLRSARFLLQIGFPIIVPDKTRRRWLQRFGLLEALKETATNRQEGLRLFGELSEQTGTPLQELDLLIGVFVGAELPEEKEAAFCTGKPRCAFCPIATTCQYGKFLQKHGRLDDEKKDERRSLAVAFLPEDRPREKLATAGAHSLTNAELLAIILRTGSGQEHAVEMANRILRDAGSLERLSRQSIAELTRIPGLGPVKAVTIKAALEMARRMSATVETTEESVSTARDVFNRMRGFFLERHKECFFALLLNTKHKITRQVLVSEGTLNQSLVHPREAFQEAIRDSAASVIFVHNHPSGDPSPSRDDRVVTQRLVQVGDIVGVRVLDHIIIARDSYYSFADQGELNK